MGRDPAQKIKAAEHTRGFPVMHHLNLIRPRVKSPAPVQGSLQRPNLEPGAMLRGRGASMMTDQATRALRDHVKGLIIRVCDVQGVAPDQVNDDAILFDKDGPLGLTSLDAVEIAVVLEHEFAVEFKNTSSIRECFQSVSTLSTHIAQHADPAGLSRVL